MNQKKQKRDSKQMYKQLTIICLAILALSLMAFWGCQLATSEAANGPTTASGFNQTSQGTTGLTTDSNHTIQASGSGTETTSPAKPTATPTSTTTMTETGKPTAKPSPTGTIGTTGTNNKTGGTTGTASASRWPAAPSADVVSVWEPDLAAWSGRSWNASPLAGITIIIDPGHGGSDPGAMQNGVSEKTLNLSVSLLLRDELKRLGASVYMTRTGDSFVSLHRRAAQTGKLVLEKHKNILQDAGMDTTIISPLVTAMDSIIAANSDKVSKQTRGIMYGYGANTDLRRLLDIERQHSDMLFLSIHSNSSDDKTLGGTMVFYSTAQAVYNDERTNAEPGMLRNPAYWYYRDDERQRLANLVYSAIAGEIPELQFNNSKPVRSGNFAVLREENLTSVLIEMAYMSHAADLAFIREAENQSSVALAIAKAVFRYYCGGS